MIWLLLEMILEVSALFNTSLVSILRWKIWTLSYFLRLEVTSSFDRYYLSQAKYAFDLLSKTSITDNKTVSTPLEYNAKLTPLDGELIFDATCYHQLVSSLIYLIVTCPDISHAIGMVNKFMDAPRSV